MKQTVKLKEEQLRNIVAESVRRVLKERYSRYIDKDKDIFVGKKEGNPYYHEYVTRDGKIHTHDTYPWASSTTSRAYGDELPPIEYDGRYDNDDMYKKYMGLPYNEDRLNKEIGAFKFVDQCRRLSAWEGEKELHQKGLPYKTACDLWRGDIQVEDLSDDEINCLVS